MFIIPDRSPEQREVHGQLVQESGAEEEDSGQAYGEALHQRGEGVECRESEGQFEVEQG